MTEAKSAYTSVTVTERGIVLYQQHAARLSLAGDFEKLFRSFAERARPGAYILVADSAGLEIRPRPPSALTDGMPVRFAISPYADLNGPFAKPAPPSLYTKIRKPGIATILTSSDGSEILESCVAAVIGWNGKSLVAPPEDRPVVRSAAIAALQAAELLTRTPIRVESEWPLALINAVAGIKTPAFPDRGPFPSKLREQIEQLLERSASRGQPGS